MGAGAQAQNLQFDCQMAVEMDFNQSLILLEEQLVVLESPPKRQPAMDLDIDRAIEIFVEANKDIQRYSSLPFKYFLTPIKQGPAGGRTLVEMGVYRRNNFAPNHREVVYSTIREVGHDKSPLEVSFQHQGKRKLNVDIICNPERS